MHNSESVVSDSLTISSLVEVFRSSYYHPHLPCAIILGQATPKLPPKLKEAWFMHTVKKNWDRLIILDFNDWLTEKGGGTRENENETVLRKTANRKKANHLLMSPKRRAELNFLRQPSPAKHHQME